MSLLWIDDFDHYTTSGIGEKYDAIYINQSIVSGRNGNGLSLSILGVVRKNLNVNAQTIIMGFAHYTNSWGYSPEIAIMDSGSNQIFFGIDGAGKIYVYRGGTCLARSSVCLAANSWYFFEIKAKIDSSAGEIEIRINGETVVSYSGNTQSTGNAYANQISLTGNRSNNLFDDLYVCDDSGSENNDFLGDHKILAFLPNDSGYSTQWTPSYGANYQMVDDPKTSAPCPDGETTYNYSASPSYTDSFNYQNMPEAGIVAGVQVSCNAKKDDGDVRSLIFFVRISGVNYYSSVKTLTTDYKYYYHCWDVNPATSISWTTDDINNAEFGYELVS